jgi:hypothetical protein
MKKHDDKEITNKTVRSQSSLFQGKLIVTKLTIIISICDYKPLQLPVLNMLLNA